jgi:hypothetical protein
MKPIDLRNATWNEVREQLAGRMLVVYEAWQKHGPGTTREIAERSGLDILTVRPRTTELYQLNFVALLGFVNKEGIYAAMPELAALEAFQQRQKAARADASQLPLKLPV